MDSCRVSLRNLEKPIPWDFSRCPLVGFEQMIRARAGWACEPLIESGTMINLQSAAKNMHNHGMLGRIIEQNETIVFGHLAPKPVYFPKTAICLDKFMHSFTDDATHAAELTSVRAFLFWAPRNTRDSSFPRKREPREITALDSRLRGNDGFFELPFCMFDSRYKGNYEGNHG